MILFERRSKELTPGKCLKCGNEASILYGAGVCEPCVGYKKQDFNMKEVLLKDDLHFLKLKEKPSKKLFYGCHCSEGGICIITRISDYYYRPVVLSKTNHFCGNDELSLKDVIIEQLQDDCKIYSSDSIMDLIIGLNNLDK